MSEIVIIDDTLIGSKLERDYELTLENVNSLSGDAKKLTDDYLIPFLFTGFNANFHKNDDVGKVKLRTRRILSVDSKKFDSEEEYKSYKKYLDILHDKIQEMDVLKTVERITILRDPTVIFGEMKTKRVKTDEESAITGKAKTDTVEDTSRNVLYSNLKNKTFSDLTNPAKLGSSLTGNTEKGMAFRGKLDRGAEAKDLIDKELLKKKFTMQRTGDTATYTLEVKEYYTELFNQMGLDLEDNFATTKRTKETKYPVGSLESTLKRQLEHVKGKNPNDVLAFKTSFNNDKRIEVGEIDSKGDFTYQIGGIDAGRKKAISELFQEKKKEGLLERVLESGVFFFKPVGENQKISINDLHIEIAYTPTAKDPNIRVWQPSDELDIKLMSKKQFIQTSGMEGMKPVVKIGSINKMMRSIDRYIARL